LNLFRLVVLHVTKKSAEVFQIRAAATGNAELPTVDTDLTSILMRYGCLLRVRY